MRYTEFKNIEPTVGDILGLEFGDTLIEAVIEDIREDGVVITLDESAVKIISEIIPSGGLRGLAGLPGDDDDDIISRYAGVPIKKTDLRVVGKDYEPPEEPSARKLADPEKTSRVSLDRAKDLTTYNPEQAENAFKWCMKHFKSLSKELVNNLSDLDNTTLLDVLRDKAANDGAYKKLNFRPVDIRNSQDLISNFYNDSSISTWEDVLTKFKTAAVRFNEAEYRGRKVSLGKPMKGDVKKSKVYVKGPKGNVVKVNFGDPNMKIKKSNPKRRKSFRARHNCENPGPRWKARYWSCRAW